MKTLARRKITMRWLLALLALVWLAAEVRADVDPLVLQAERARVEVVETASQATIAIFAKGGQGGGSGVVISPDGYALSNFHVTHETGVAMKCGMADGKLYDAVIVGLDPTGDVALVKLLGRDDFPHAEMADSDKVRAGDACFTIGNPFLLATDFHPSVAYGVVSGVHRYQYPAGSILEYTDCIQADAAINPGNSGGPMFDAEGRLIGINGRGSFEKRGRVNVGVGYAISINQVKNFLGHLKSGRIVDHATLGAQVRSDENRRVVVDDVLEESDAFRRGLRYGDEMLSFGGRSISTVNAFKNVLGIFPKGWRVPLSFQHKAERFDVLVRLRGLHREAELAELAQGGPQIDPEKMPQPKGEEPDGKKKDGNKPGDGPDGRPRGPKKPGIPRLKAPAKPAPLPAIVKEHYIERPGYVNYYFNQLNRDRVWKAFVARGDYSALSGAWTLAGRSGIADDVRFELSDKQAAIRLPSGQLGVEIEGQLGARLDPPASGGMLVALAMWRRFLITGPENFGEVYYLGTAPLEGHEKLFDVLAAAHADIECRLMFDPDTGQLAALEMYPEEDTDPCELYFSEYQEIEGRMLPTRIEVRHGEDFAQVYQCKEYTFEQPPQK